MGSAGGFGLTCPEQCSHCVSHLINTTHTVTWKEILIYTNDGWVLDILGQNVQNSRVIVFCLCVFV